MFIGIDGCKGGWFCTAVKSLNAPYWQMEFITSLTEISGAIRQSELVLIDMPIGLRSRNNNERVCDSEARIRLAPEQETAIYPVPCRRALKSDTYAEASAVNYGCTGRKLSQQTWNAIPKIREVDLYIRRRQLRGRIRETRPELVFWALNNQQPLQSSKKTDEGFEERMEVLGRYFSETRALINAFLISTSYGQGVVERDDVIDSLACAVAAACKGRLMTLPDKPEVDARGLPMEMVYPGFQR